MSARAVGQAQAWPLKPPVHDHRSLRSSTGRWGRFGEAVFLLPITIEDPRLG